MPDNPGGYRPHCPSRFIPCLQLNSTIDRLLELEYHSGLSEQIRKLFNDPGGKGICHFQRLLLNLGRKSQYRIYNFRIAGKLLHP
ncbi:hypothetical protein J2Z22_003537 [Paenibacillus forsythiae]|uniref:Uncharacterized protein n=1 Tax=Paenibacillus forsythiae TaxID=365616 RepID=A0ABU3HAV6_9BACL|nr:hypothetical protein [Paenibacillus forsythiae]